MYADFEAGLREFNGDDNHVHLLVNFPPAIAIFRLVNSLKGVSSRRLRQEFPDLRLTTGGLSGCGRDCTLPGRSAAPPSLSCASTSKQQQHPA